VKYVGIDVHKKHCQAAVLDEDGELLDQIRFLNKKKDIKEFALKLLTFRDDVKAVVESTGNLWIQIHDILEKFGIDVSLSNPGKTRLIAEAKNKTDKVDAKILARLLRADMLFTCYVLGEEIRNRREFLRHRLNLVKMRTMVKTRIHSLLDKYTLRSPYNSWTKKWVAWLREQDLGFMDNAIIKGQLAILETFNEQIRVMEDKIAAIAVDDPQVKLLMTMPGIGYFTASLLVAEIGDINRFGNAKKISSWAGLAPRISQSGETTHIGRVGKGNKRVAALMVQSAHNARRYDARFSRAYKQVSRRGGKGKAIVAVAHEMIRIVYFMLRDNAPYRGQNVELTTRKLKNMEGRASIGLRI
jgi:transposase